MATAVCVYCSSSNHIDPAFFEVARQLGQRIAQRGDSLVYGGGSTGLMGEVARSVKAEGGKVVGVIPESMDAAERTWREADEIIITQTMRQRKQIMEDRADGFVVLPGGFGTLEELVEILTLRALGYHAKPIAILNTHAFWEPMRVMFEHFYEHHFAKPKVRDLYTFTESVDEALKVIDTV